jgi:hypothetical protein
MAGGTKRQRGGACKYIAVSATVRHCRRRNNVVEESAVLAHVTGRRALFLDERERGPARQAAREALPC